MLLFVLANVTLYNNRQVQYFLKFLYAQNLTCINCTFIIIINFIYNYYNNNMTYRNLHDNIIGTEF